MVSVGKNKVILFQLSSNDWQQRQNAQNDSKENIMLLKSNSMVCEIYQQDILWNISPPIKKTRRTEQNRTEKNLFRTPIGSKAREDIT